MRPLGGGFEVSCEVLDHVDYGFIADGSVDHGVVGGAVGPFVVKILFDEIGTIAVNGIDKLFGFRLTLAVGQQSADFISAGSVEEYSQSILAVPEKMLRASTDDDGVPGLRGVLDDLLGELQDALGIHELEFVGVQTAFVASA